MIEAAIPSTPDNHFAAGPHCCVPVSACRRVGGAGGGPTIRVGIVSAAGVQLATPSAPDDHFTAGPHGRVIPRPEGALVVLVAVQVSCAGVVSPAGVQTRRHRPRRSFHCRSTLLCDRSSRGRVGGVGGCPTIRAGIVSTAGVQMATSVIRPRRSFHCQSRLLCAGLGQWARWLVLVDIHVSSVQTPEGLAITGSV